MKATHKIREDNLTFEWDEEEEGVTIIIDVKDSVHNEPSSRGIVDKAVLIKLAKIFETRVTQRC